MTPEAQSALHIAIAALGGMAIGIERQWSGHATGPAARFGGVRTFTLLGALAGVAGVCWALGAPIVAAVLAAGGAAIVIAGYAAISRKDIEGTTEMAALVVLASGLLAGTGHLALASGLIAVTALLLVEKRPLHRAVAQLEGPEVRAAVQFAVMAVVILPLLPEGPFGPLGGIRPRQLWILVLFFSGLSFAGFIARRMVGERHGYVLAGLLGGLISSTSVTITFARASRDQPKASRTLAFGILAACTVMYLRVLVATGVLNVDLMTALIPYVVPPFLVSAAIALIGLRQTRSKEAPLPETGNPLAIKRALQMAAAFQIVLFLVHGARELWGGLGLVISGAILGLTDMDALTISMARTAETQEMLYLAAQAVAVGVLSNTLFKAALAAIIGRGAVRMIVPLALLAAAAASGAMLLVLLR